VPHTSKQQFFFCHKATLFIMVYPPAPGTNNLPPRPPPSANSGGSGGFNKGGFKPAFGAAQQPQPQQHASPYPRTSTPTYPGSSASPAPSYGPVAPPPPPAAQRPQYGQPPTYSAAYGGGRGAVSAAPYSYPQQPPPPQQYQPQAYSAPQTYASAPSYSSAPQIRNPFPQAGPGSGAGAAASDYDPEMAAQIAQWQSAYSSRENLPLDKDGKPIVAVAAGAEPPKPEQPAAGANPDKKKTVAREGGGKKWTDDTLLEWDPSHLRLFVGNLAGETTDDSLLKAFSRWGSVQKARVVRDKRTTKSKGFGFVSFSDADDFFQAAKEMNGKYIQSHPVVVRKANTEIKVTNVKDKGRGGKKGGYNNHRNSNDKKKHDGSGYEPNLGPMGGGGVTKPGQKTKNGLRLLG
jgi:hypothetical protein